MTYHQSIMTYDQAKSKLAKYGQTHLLRFWNELSGRQQQTLLSEIASLDLAEVKKCYESDDVSAKEGDIITPIEGYLTMSDINARCAHFRKIGIEAMKGRKVAAVILAGGQGTRLGFDGPKGALNIGINREICLFERHVKELLKITEEVGVHVPLLIMTSDKNDRETREFFKSHDYFGYGEEHVYFFVQEMAPTTDFDGKINLEAKEHVSFSPNGNGGWFKSIVNCGLINLIRTLGVEWFNVVSVDNPLQKIADPVFVGATIESGAPIGAKVVSKAEPLERVGVMCMRNGNPSIVEYYELTEEMANERDAKGELVYRWGVILNYLFRIENLRLVQDEYLPCHKVEKKIPYLDNEGNLIKPSEPNGYKYEGLVLDLIELLDDCLVFEIDREKEFAPIKNATGVDSIESARELLKKNGVEL